MFSSFSLNKAIQVCTTTFILFLCLIKGKKVKFQDTDILQQLSQFVIPHHDETGEPFENLENHLNGTAHNATILVHPLSFFFHEQDKHFCTSLNLMQTFHWNVDHCAEDPIQAFLDPTSDSNHDPLINTMQLVKIFTDGDVSCTDYLWKSPSLLERKVIFDLRSIENIVLIRGSLEMVEYLQPDGFFSNSSSSRDILMETCQILLDRGMLKRVMGILKLKNLDSQPCHDLIFRWAVGNLNSRLLRSLLQSPFYDRTQFPYKSITFLTNSQVDEFSFLIGFMGDEELVKYVGIPYRIITAYVDHGIYDIVDMALDLPYFDPFYEDGVMLKMLLLTENPYLISIFTNHPRVITLTGNNEEYNYASIIASIVPRLKRDLEPEILHLMLRRPDGFNANRVDGQESLLLALVKYNLIRTISSIAQYQTFEMKRSVIAYVRGNYHLIDPAMYRVLKEQAKLLNDHESYSILSDCESRRE